VSISGITTYTQEDIFISFVVYGIYKDALSLLMSYRIAKYTKSNIMERAFTMDDALKIQMDNLKQWKKVLNQSTYIKLLDEVIILNNKGYSSPYDVCRGSDITSILQNLMIKL
jgi:hypothetical protein